MNMIPGMESVHQSVTSKLIVENLKYFVNAQSIINILPVTVFVWIFP